MRRCQAETQSRLNSLPYIRQGQASSGEGGREEGVGMRCRRRETTMRAKVTGD